MVVVKGKEWIVEIEGPQCLHAHISFHPTLLHV